jgi:hypothetical protein
MNKFFFVVSKLNRYLRKQFSFLIQAIDLVIFQDCNDSLSLNHKVIIYLLRVPQKFFINDYF